MSGVDLDQVNLYTLHDKLGGVELLAKGITRAKVFDNYQAMITWANGVTDKEKADEYRRGDHILIKKLDVPDLWISEIHESYEDYSGSTEDTVVASAV
jgi:hypothetical protein